MATELASTTNAPASVECVHCGLPSPPPRSGELAFCCEGCRGAYHLIHEWGLDDYYALRDQLGGPQRSADVALQLDQFDNPEALGESVPIDCGGGLVRSRLAVQGLHCAACAWLIERAATQQPGWFSARVRLSDHTLEAVYDPKALRLGQIAELVAKLGYSLAPLIESEKQKRFEAENRQHWVRIAAAGFCVANAMWIAVALYAGTYSGMAAEHRYVLHWAGVLLGLASVAFPGQTFFRGAFHSLRTRTPHMDLPVALGLSVGAISGLVVAVIGEGEAYFDSVAMLVFLLLIGRWIQFRQQRRATEAVSLLMRLTPRLALKVLEDGTTQRVIADSLASGDVCRVDAGELFPVDGIVQSGATLVDRSLVTGESRPVEVVVGEPVEAGSCNLQSTVNVQVVAVGRESRVGKIASLIEEAASDRAPIVQLADSIGGRFVVIVIGIAIATFAYWWQSDRAAAAEYSTALLIVACPCALALATPLAIAVAIGRCAKRGILIRGADSLERLNQAGTVWFDKTGTLTEGRLCVTRWEGDEESLAMAASIEMHSRHVVAEAIVQAAKVRGLSIPEASEVCQVPGCGVEGIVDGYRVQLGNQALMARHEIRLSDEQSERVAAIAHGGESPLLVTVDGVVVAIAAIGDSIRRDAKQVVNQLVQKGWQVGILSGDHPVTVETVARRLGIAPAMAFGRVSPEDKLAQIRDSKRAGQTVLMVGDGVNDAAALAAADVGVAIRGGAAASLDAAPVYLAGGSLSNLVDLVNACQRTIRTIRRNFAISLSYNILAVTLAASGWISPLIAAILMPISSLSVLSIVLASRTFPEADPSTTVNRSWREAKVSMPEQAAAAT